MSHITNSVSYTVLFLYRAYPQFPIPKFPIWDRVTVSVVKLGNKNIELEDFTVTILLTMAVSVTYDQKITHCRHLQYGLHRITVVLLW